MFKIGIGYDIHQLDKSRKLILGGVEIPHYQGLLGHSDADVLLHAIMDALLGAAGLPDIGHFFPNDDEKYKNADSLFLLEEVANKINQIYKIGNIDTVLICEKPKLAPYLDVMKKKISQASNCLAVNIKVTTSEQMNDEGAEKCISAQAVCLLFEKKLEKNL